MRRPPSLASGTLIGGDYRVLERIGEGGMGAVYVAEQVSTGRRRALKVLHPELVPDPKSVERFVEEARTSGRIPSEHVVQVLGAGVDRDPMVPWMAMELLEGEDLSEAIARDGALPLSLVCELVRQLGHAVGAAHRMGIVHRDLKPENLFLAKSQRVSEALTLKVLDFGIAKTVAQSETAVTSTSAIGSPLFMSPEQTSPGAQLRPATDVWAIGLIVFEALVGVSYWRAANTPPFNLQALLTEVLIHPLASASERALELGRADAVPPGFDAWFAQCVSREAGARFAEAGACTEAFLQQFAGARAEGAEPPSTQGAARPSAEGAAAPSFDSGGVEAFAATQGVAPAAPWDASGASHGGFAPAPAYGAFPASGPGIGGQAPSSARRGVVVGGLVAVGAGLLLLMCLSAGFLLQLSDSPETSRPVVASPSSPRLLAPPPAVPAASGAYPEPTPIGAPIPEAPPPPALEAPPLDDPAASASTDAERAASARECAAQGDHRCVIRALEGHATSAEQLGMLIEAYRASGRSSDAGPAMTAFVERYPSHPRARGYRMLLSRM